MNALGAPMAAERIFDKFTTEVAEIIVSTADVTLVPRLVRRRLVGALASISLVEAAIERAIESLEGSGSSSVSALLCDDDVASFAVRLVHWPPKFANSPHEHTFWTVTGVMTNRLFFTIYDKDPKEQGRPRVDRTFWGKRGEAGFIVPPQVHSVANPTDEHSFSIHIFSGPRASAAENPIDTRGDTTWYGSAVTPSDAHLARALVGVLESLDSPRSRSLLDLLFDKGDLRAALAAAKAMARMDPVHAASRLLELANRCEQGDAVRLRQFADRLRGL